MMSLQRLKLFMVDRDLARFYHMFDSANATLQFCKRKTRQNLNSFPLSFAILLIFIISPFVLCAKGGEENAKSDESKKAPGGATQQGAEEAEKTLKEGNLAFPPSQQPTPLVSFGQNIINRKELQAEFQLNEFKGDRQYFINAIPILIYAFTDNFSLLLSAPIAVRYREGHHHSSGPQDTLIQFEYSFYTKAYRTFYDQATVVASVTIPTGSTKKTPATGIGSNSFFIGGTYSRMGINWFYFVSSGGLLTTSSHRMRAGNQFLYQMGIGRRIYNSAEWLFAWMIEFDGTYFWPDIIKGRRDPNSGGNIIYLTPSLWISSKDSVFFQFGIGVPIQQHLFGNQKKMDYQLIFQSGWLF